MIGGRQVQVGVGLDTQYGRRTPESFLRRDSPGKQCGDGTLAQLGLLPGLFHALGEIAGVSLTCVVVDDVPQGVDASDEKRGILRATYLQDSTPDHREVHSDSRG